MARLLFILTKTTEVGEAGRPTGFHYQEMADVYYGLSDSGIDIDIATVEGKEAHPAPDSFDKDTISKNEKSVQRFMKDEAALEKIKKPLNLSSLKPDAYEGVYFPGGYGAMWDLPCDKHVIKFVEEMNNTGKIIAAVCHGPAALVNAKNSDGLPLVKNRRINCFTDEEEREMNMHDVMPFLLESKLRACGGLFENAPPMKCHVAEDKNLITGQNPASAAKLAKILLSKLS